MGITLFISEKPSLGRTVAKAIGVVKDTKTHVVCKDDCVVAFAQGHLYDYKMPDEYDPRYKQWRREDLPLNIPKLILKAQESTQYRLDVIREFLGKASRVIHVGDPDREGQRIVDDILEQCGWKGPVERLWNTDQSERGMKNTMEEFHKGFPDNSLPIYHNMLLASRARAEIDWRLGMNFSRAIGCRLNKAGVYKVVSYGRFQSTVLAIIVAREIERRNFKPKKFYVPKAIISGIETEFIHDRETFADGYDPEGYLVNRDVAKRICDLVKGKEGEVTEFERKKGTKSPPLPYDLSRLIQDANNLYKISAKETNDIAQKLYDAGITTYPRVDCRYLPDGHHQDAARILQALEGLPGVDNADPRIKGKCFNSRKTDEAAHHAIVPTGDPWQQLTGKDLQIFQLVARNYILQFHPDQEFETQKLTVRFPGPPPTEWKATGKKVLVPGWTAVMKDDDDDGSGELPSFKKGEKVTCDNAIMSEGETKKPAAFTEASIINAMENVDRFETNPEYKKLLKTAKGIGTGATRGGILEILQKRDYITIQKGVISPTKFGEDVISYLPEPLYSPALTAVMEGRLEDIAQGKSTPEEVLSEIEETIPEYLEQIDGVDIKPDPKNTQICPACKEGAARRFPSKTGRYFWKCQNEACGAYFNDNNGRLVVPEKCPECGVLGVNRFESSKNKGFFYWRCKGCGKGFRDVNGKLGPVYVERQKVLCPGCGKHDAVRYESKSKPGSFFWKCEECGFFDDDNGKIGGRTIDRFPQAKCPTCGGLAIQLKSKKSGMPFWKCQANGDHAFRDEDGKPGTPFGSFSGTKSETATCPHCKKEKAYKNQSKSGTSWYWRCPKCGNMRDDNGKPGDLFDKDKGKK